MIITPKRRILHRKRNLEKIRETLFTFINKGKSTLVPVVPKITARRRQMKFCIFIEKYRQNEMGYVVYSLNVNKV